MTDFDWRLTCKECKRDFDIETKEYWSPSIPDVWCPYCGAHFEIEEDGIHSDDGESMILYIGDKVVDSERILIDKEDLDFFIEYLDYGIRDKWSIDGCRRRDMLKKAEKIKNKYKL